MGDELAVEELLNAVYRKNDREVFARVFDLNKKDSKELTPLHYAMLYENLKCISLLAANSARFDVVHKGMLPIHMACLLGKVDVLRALVDSGKGVGVDDTDMISNATPLFYAAFAGSIPCIELLLSKSAFIDAEDTAGYTPLLIAGYGF